MKSSLQCSYVPRAVFIQRDRYLRIRGGHRNFGRGGGGGSVMNNQQGEGAGRGVPLPREARKLMGVPHLCTG